MDMRKIVEITGQSHLPFVYSGERLNEEKCQKALKKIGADTNVLAVIVSDALFGKEGIAVLENGIKFSLSSGSTGDMKYPKIKGEYSFADFIIHDVSVKKGLLPKFDVSMVLWDKKKNKSFTFQFGLVQDDFEFEESMNGELESIFKCLTTKTGTEYVSPSETGVSGDAGVQESEKKQNDFDFVWGSTHTTITVNDDTITIHKTKIDDKTKIQTSKGDPTTISRSAIDSFKIKRRFSPVPLLGGMAAGAAIGFIIFGGIYAFLLGTILGLIGSFPKTLVIYRKDGTKFKTVISGDTDNTKEYNRLMNIVFK
jgi:hypothetical protein